MTSHTAPERRSLLDRARGLVTDQGHRVTVFTVVAYLAAALGLGVAFLGGIDDPNSALATVGIVLLFVSFASLFYVSVTVLSLEQGA